MNVQALAIDPHTPNTLYAGTDGSGIFRSTDSGASWSAIGLNSPGLTGAYVSALAIEGMSRILLN